MKKVLFIYKFLPHYRVDFYNQLREKLLQHKIELHLIYGRSNRIDSLKQDEVEIDWAQYIPNWRFFLGKTEVVWQPCLKFLKDKDLIIVQPENKLILNFFLVLTKKFFKYKIAFWGHVNNMQDNPDSLRNKIKLPFLRLCDWWFGYTQSAEKYLIAKRYPKDQITVVNNAIDTISLRKDYSQINAEQIDKLRNSLGVTGNNVGIYCGGMYPQKDIDFILKTSHRVKEKLADFHILFLGSGEESTKIINASKHADWIHYVGPKFGKERVIYFKISSIQIMPRLVGLSIVDSFALQTPIITTSHPFHGPEIDYLINGVNGIMTEDNLEQYSNAIIGILKSKEYMELIDGGNLSANEYTVQNMAENFKDGILSCLSS